MTARLVDELRKVSTFEGLPAEALEWLAGRMELRELGNGEIISHEGDAAVFMTVVLEGELRGTRESAADDGRVYVARAGQVTGMLPYSRLTHLPLMVRAAMPSRVAMLHKDHFAEMLKRIPELQGRLVNVMADRIRETTAADQQRDKLSALGKLSAGLAHELNNPAAAARRAAQAMKEAVEALRQANACLDEMELSAEQRQMLGRVEQETFEEKPGEELDALERSDREERLAAWLDQRGTRRTWELAPGLVEAGATEACLANLADKFPTGALEAVLTRLTASVSVKRLMDEIDNSTSRISDLVRAIKEYSYMDQMPEQEVDIHAGIESTLLILKHRWKNGIEIRREYDRSLPAICAKGSELNQVWTNLIDNAIDAMEGKGVLGIRTARELSSLLVVISDSGPGVPPEIQSRIFEPFFTTKPAGEGTGLGLDTAYRIVRNHRGNIRLDSKPGDTRFEVRLPFARQSASPPNQPTSPGSKP